MLYCSPFECCLVLQNGHQFQAIIFLLGGGGGMVGLAITLIEMNHKISVYYVKWGVVIHLVLALIVQCRYVFFASKFCSQIQFYTFG